MAVAGGGRKCCEAAGFAGSSRAVASWAKPLPRNTLRMALVPVSWGWCGVSWRVMGKGEGLGEAFAGGQPDGLLCRIVMPGLSAARLRRRMEVLHGAALAEVLADGRGGFHPDTVPEWFGELVGFLEGYFSGGSGGSAAEAGWVDVWSYWEPRLDWSGLTEFQRAVLRVVARIPRGSVLTYGEVARRVGRAGAARAVGAVMRSNPWPVLVPCHRVVGSAGALTGFSAPGGVEAKRRMLEMEGGRVEGKGARG